MLTILTNLHYVSLLMLALLFFLFQLHSFLRQGGVRGITSKPLILTAQMIESSALILHTCT